MEPGQLHSILFLCEPTGMWGLFCSEQVRVASGTWQTSKHIKSLCSRHFAGMILAVGHISKPTSRGTEKCMLPPNWLTMEGNNNGSTNSLVSWVSYFSYRSTHEHILAYFKVGKERAASVDIMKAGGEKGKEKKIFFLQFCTWSLVWRKPSIYTKSRSSRVFFHPLLNSQWNY